MRTDSGQHAVWCPTHDRCARSSPTLPLLHLRRRRTGSRRRRCSLASSWTQVQALLCIALYCFAAAAAALWVCCFGQSGQPRSAGSHVQRRHPCGPVRRCSCPRLAQPLSRSALACANCRPVRACQGQDLGTLSGGQPRRLQVRNLFGRRVRQQLRQYARPAGANAAGGQRLRAPDGRPMAATTPSAVLAPCCICPRCPLSSPPCSKVRVFRFSTGKLSRAYDESLSAANELQRSESGGLGGVGWL